MSSSSPVNVIDPYELQSLVNRVLQNSHGQDLFQCLNQALFRQYYPYVSSTHPHRWSKDVIVRYSSASECLILAKTNRARKHITPYSSCCDTWDIVLKGRVKEESLAQMPGGTVYRTTRRQVRNKNKANSNHHQQPQQQPSSQAQNLPISQPVIMATPMIPFQPVIEMQPAQQQEQQQQQQPEREQQPVSGFEMPSDSAISLPTTKSFSTNSFYKRKRRTKNGVTEITEAASDPKLLKSLLPQGQAPDQNNANTTTTTQQQQQEQNIAPLIQATQINPDQTLNSLPVVEIGNKKEIRNFIKYETDLLKNPHKHSKRKLPQSLLHSMCSPTHQSTAPFTFSPQQINLPIAASSPALNIMMTTPKQGNQLALPIQSNNLQTPVLTTPTQLALSLPVLTSFNTMNQTNPSTLPTQSHNANPFQSVTQSSPFAPTLPSNPNEFVRSPEDGITNQMPTTTPNVPTSSPDIHHHHHDISQHIHPISHIHKHNKRFHSVSHYEHMDLGISNGGIKPHRRPHPPSRPHEPHSPSKPSHRKHEHHCATAPSKPSKPSRPRPPTHHHYHSNFRVNDDSDEDSAGDDDDNSSDSSQQRLVTLENLNEFANPMLTANAPKNGNQQLILRSGDMIHRESGTQSITVLDDDTWILEYSRGYFPQSYASSLFLPFTPYPQSWVSAIAQSLTSTFFSLRNSLFSYGGTSQEAPF